MAYLVNKEHYDSGPDDVEDGYVVVSDSPTAGWDGDQSSYLFEDPNPPSWRSRIAGGIRDPMSTIHKGVEAASNVAKKVVEVIETLPEQEPDINAIPHERSRNWKPPLNAFNRDDTCQDVIDIEVPQALTKAQIKLNEYKKELRTVGQQQRVAGPAFQHDDHRYDALGFSGTWQRPERRENDKERRARMMAEWRAREDRGVRNRDRERDRMSEANSVTILNPKAIAPQGCISWAGMQRNAQVRISSPMTTTSKDFRVPGLEEAIADDITKYEKTVVEREAEAFLDLDLSAIARNIIDRADRGECKGANI